MHKQSSSSILNSDPVVSLLSQRLLKVFFVLASLESLVCAVYLMSMPADPKNVILLGFSARRLVVIAAVLALFMLTGFLAYSLFRKSSLAESWSGWVQSRLKFLRFSLAAAALVFLAGWVISLTPPYRFNPYDLIYKGLQPVIVLGTVISLEIALWLMVAGYGWDWAQMKNALRQQRSLVRSMLVIYGVLLLGWGIIALTGLGIKPDVTFWNTPGVPLLSALAMAGWAVGVFLLILARILPHRDTQTLQDNPSAMQIISGWGKRADWIICLVIFVVGAVIWLVQPVQPAFFAPGPSEPNQEIYPYSDSSVYDIAAQFALIGQGLMDGNQVDKPLYSTFLLILHLFARQNFSLLTGLQVIAFAIIPVLVYLIVKAIADRVSGVVAAMLVIFKIATAIISATSILYANPRLLLSELPTAIGLLFFTLFLIQWWKHQDTGWIYLALAGGSVGLLTLIRHNSWILVPFMFAIILWVWRKKFRLVLFSGAIFLLALLVSILPWMVRSYINTGTPWYFFGTFRSVVWTNRYGLDEESWLYPAGAAADPAVRAGQALSGGGVSTLSEDILLDGEACGDIDSLEVLAVRNYDDVAKSILYCGEWQAVEDENAYHSTLHVSDTVGDSVYVKFKGNRLVLMYNAYIDGGNLGISVDGKKIGTIDPGGTGKRTWRLRWTSPDLDLLGNKEHLLVLTHETEGTVALDGILIQLSSFITTLNDISTKLSSMVVFIPSHFVHNLVTSILVLPSALLNDDMNHLVGGENSLWLNTWDGSLSLGQTLFLLVDLILFAAGLAYTWKRYHLAGWAPLLVYLLYNLGTAVARTSGGRYISPIDWVVLVYYAAGLVQFTCWAAVPFGFRLPEEQQNEEPGSGSSPSFQVTFKAASVGLAVALAGLLLVGASPLIFESVFPRAYPNLSLEERVQMLEENNLTSLMGVSAAELESFANQEYSVIWTGKALYPRFYYMNKGEPSTKGVYRILAYPRLAFTVVGPDGLIPAILALGGEGTYPSYFPHAADVVVLGCYNGEFTDVLAMIVEGAESRVYLRSPSVPLACPLPEPVCEDDQNCYSPTP